MMQPIIFTDLDGTLLDRAYSWKNARKAIRAIKQKKIPLVLCTSKTRTETVFWQKKLDINGPFIIENGGAIIIPRNYFGNKKKKTIRLGASSKKLKDILENIEHESSSKLLYFSKMSSHQIRNLCNLPLEQAKKSKRREYTQPFRVLKGNITEIRRLIRKNRLNYTRAANFHYIMGSNDKGKAVRILLALYRKKYGKILSIGLGDSLNDKPMLKAVDKPFLIKKGPGEWNKIILRIIDKLDNLDKLKKTC